MIRIALPKGSLQKQTFKFFKDSGLDLNKTETDFVYTADNPNIDEARFLNPREIPRVVEKGDFDIGIVGSEWIMETDSQVVEIVDLSNSNQGFGSYRIALIVPVSSEITGPEDIADGSSIATEYPSITKRYFESYGKNVEIHYSIEKQLGKTPKVFDAYVERIVGDETFRKGDFRVIGVILDSTVKLIANKESYHDAEKQRVLEEIVGMLLAR